MDLKKIPRLELAKRPLSTDKSNETLAFDRSEPCHFSHGAGGLRWFGAKITSLPSGFSLEKMLLSVPGYA